MTSQVQQNGAVPITKLRNMRVDDDTWLAAKAAAKAEGETVSAVLVRSLHAYVADPQGFNAAVAQLRGKKGSK